jgi:hypothetical protein
MDNNTFVIMMNALDTTTTAATTACDPINPVPVIIALTMVFVLGIILIVKTNK